MVQNTVEHKGIQQIYSAKHNGTQRESAENTKRGMVVILREHRIAVCRHIADRSEILPGYRSNKRKIQRGLYILARTQQGYSGGIAKRGYKRAQEGIQQ